MKKQLEESNPSKDERLIDEFKRILGTDVPRGMMLLSIGMTAEQISRSCKIAEEVLTRYANDRRGVMTLAALFLADSCYQTFLSDESTKDCISTWKM